MSEVTNITTPIRLDYTYTAGRATQRFLLGMAAGQLDPGSAAPNATRLRAPRGACPKCGVPTTDEVEVTGKGTVTTYCIVRIPSDVLSVPPPFTCAHVPTAPTCRSSR
jgi:uncharacterized OB-fold protein